MTIELSPEEIEAIQSWYRSALSESATFSDSAERSLIAKLSLTGNYSDDECSWCRRIPHWDYCVMK